MKLRSRPAGMTLLSVLVAASISAIVVLGIAKMLGNLSMTSRSLRQSGEMTDLATTVRLVLRNPSFCRCNLTPSASPRTFAVAAAGTTVYDLPSLKAFDDTCTDKGILIEKTATEPASDVWVKEIQVKSLARIDDNNYLGKLRVAAEKTKGSAGGYAREFPIMFSAITAAGNVTLTGCQPTGSVDMKCQGTLTLRPFDAYSEDGLPGPMVPELRKCASPTQVMTACQAILFPSGTLSCGTWPMRGRDTDGRAYCHTHGCGAVAGQRWGVITTCCDVFEP